MSTTCELEREVLVYALLDTQSDTTFILEETANALNTRKEAFYNGFKDNIFVLYLVLSWLNWFAG